ncbi:[Pyruvate dehydrogenase (acetyl-transferring)] kinase isozyme 2 [Basidiobolus ranarum]|uniref:Protein-serine/threonine kinase n=1 Tax=Basidiobolus ranarum TaxID=34480 RepID=A0ABR2WK09_9FUNG
MNATKCLRALNKQLFTRLATAPLSRTSLQQMYAMERSTPASSLILSLFSSDATKAQDHVKILAPMEFLHSELPIRLCQNIKLLNTRLPFEPIDPQVDAKIHQITLNLLEDISLLTDLSVPTESHHITQFTSALRVLQARQLQNLTSLRDCLNHMMSEQVWKCNHNPSAVQQKIDHFLMDYLSLNYGTSFLIGQSLNQQDGFQPVINEISPRLAAAQAIQKAQSWCSQYYCCESPEVTLVGRNSDVSILAANNYLQDSLFHVMKHSISSVIEHSKTSGTSSSKMPPLQVRITEGEEDICLRVSDLGGGIPMSKVSNLWSQLNASPARSKMAKGLPMTRLISRYFGGDLEIVSMEGYGTESYLYLDKKGSIGECIPAMRTTEEEVDSLTEKIFTQVPRKETARPSLNESHSERVAVTA